MNATLEKSLDYIVILLTFLAGILFLATAFNSFYWMDDFWKRFDILQVGFIQFQKDIYLNWDGRAISPVYTVRNVVLYFVDYHYSWFATLIAMGFLVATSFLFLKMLALNNWKEFSIEKKWIFTTLICCILILVFRPHLSRSLYWATGTFYIYANFFSILIMSRLLFCPESKWNWFWIFTAVSSGPNNGVMVLAFLFLGHFLKIILLTPQNFYFLFLIGISALVLVVIAPGNFTRAGGQIDFALMSMVLGGWTILKEYIGMSLWIFPGSLIIAITLASKINQDNIALPLLICCSASALCSILPFLPMPIAASKHTSIFFQTFFLLGLILFWLFLKNQFYYKIPSGSIYPLLIFTFLFFANQMIIQLITGRSIKIEIDKRFEIMEANRGSNMELCFAPIIIPSNNWVSRFWDISEDPTYSSNIHHQQYFETGKIKLKQFD